MHTGRAATSSDAARSPSITGARRRRRTTPSSRSPGDVLRRAHWKASCFNVGALGHINADSRLGDWPVGLQMLKTLEMRIARLTRISRAGFHNRPFLRLSISAQRSLRRQIQFVFRRSHILSFSPESDTSPSLSVSEQRIIPIVGLSPSPFLHLSPNLKIHVHLPDILIADLVRFQIDDVKHFENIIVEDKIDVIVVSVRRCCWQATKAYPLPSSIMNFCKFVIMRFQLRFRIVNACG